MKISDAFPSKYLKVDDLNDADMLCTITRVALEELGQGHEKDTKPIVYFAETDKGMACNKTNAGVISKLYGDDTDGWIGKKITLWPNHDVEFRGEIVSAIRVRSRAPSTIAPPTRQSGQYIDDAETFDFVLAVKRLEATVHVDSLLSDFGYKSLEHVPVNEQQAFIVYVKNMIKRAESAAQARS